ncbi:MAG: DUF5107 domain-containing protein, partial [Verrucomicrobiota bacterium]
THLALGRTALAKADAAVARDHFTQAFAPTRNLGEVRHLLANQSDIHYWLGLALEKLGDAAGAKRHWKHAADFRGDFQEMSVRAYSDMTYYSALSLEKLERKPAARKLLNGLLAYARRLAKTPAQIDYFATSLPTMLLFDDDLALRNEINARFLEAQARLGLGQRDRARSLLVSILQRDPAHALAADLLDQS